MSKQASERAPGEVEIMECTLFCFTGSKDDGDDDDDHSLTCLPFCKTTHSENVFSKCVSFICFLSPK